MVRKNKKDPWDEDEEIILVSKSEMKRDMLQLQKIGEQLVNLKPATLAKIPLSDELRKAILDAQRFKNEAHRRQLQYIGKLMRHEDPEPIQHALDKIANKHSQVSTTLHKLEKLRDQLITGDDAAIKRVVELYPAIDRQRLRQLSRIAAKKIAAQKPEDHQKIAKGVMLRKPKAAREIFQMLQEQEGFI